MREDRKMGEASVYFSSVEARRCVAFSSAEKLARTMLDIPEGMKVAIVRGRDGEGREFYSLSDPVIDVLYFPEEQQIDLKRMMVDEVYTSRDIREGRKVLTFLKRKGVRVSEWEVVPRREEMKNLGLRTT